jgi:GAF domain-containing protein/HAMP domain-containing protein
MVNQTGAGTPGNKSGREDAMTRNNRQTDFNSNGMRRFKRRSIRRRILISYIVLALIPAASISFVSVYLFQNYSRIQEFSQLAPAAVEVVLIAAAVSFLLTIFFAFKLTDRISLPVEKLGKTVERISGGELNLAAEIEQEDEIGSLARSFNRITAQALSLGAKLERQTSERKEDQERRSHQIQAAADVAREASRLYNQNELLDYTANLIGEKFGCYYVGIYLLDDNLEYAVLKAASGEAGQELLRNSHRLRATEEEGPPGFTPNTGQTRAAATARTKGFHFSNPLLPEALSQVVLPIKVGEKVIGAMDVQSIHKSCFDSLSVTVLQIIVDQLAMAVENASMLQQRDQIIKEIEAAYGNYTLSSWQEYMKRSAQLRGYRFRGKSPEPDSEPEPESLEAWQAEQVVRKTFQSKGSKAKGDVSQTLAIPMRIRGQTIGVTNIRLEGDEPSPETVALFEEVVNRLSLTLENVRLLEEAQLRSEQLHLLQEITSAAAAHINLIELLEAVCGIILEGFHLSRCGVLMLDKNRTEASLMVDERRDLLSLDMTGVKVQFAGNEALQEFVYLQRSGISEDIQVSPSTHLMHEFFASRGSHMLLVVPLISMGETIGLILMETDEQNRRFREDDLRLADQIGLQVSTAIDVANLFEQTERRAEKEKLISEVTTHIRETLDIETVLKTAAREMRRALNLVEVEIRLGTLEVDGQNGEKGLDYD